MDAIPGIGTLLSEKKKRKNRPSRPQRLAVIFAAVALVVLVASLMAGLRFGQPLPDVQGVWQGSLYQRPGGMTSTYFFEMQFTQTEGQVYGTSRIWTGDDPPSYGLMEFTGTWQEDTLRFTETRILEQKLPDDWRWCLKTGLLTLRENTLSGTWSAPGCEPGTIHLSRQGE